MGESFASRVAASLLNAIEMPELITNSIQEYEELAIVIDKDPQRVVALKQKLENNKLTTPLFDSTSFAQNIEELFALMYESYYKDTSQTSFSPHQHPPLCTRLTNAL